MIVEPSSLRPRSPLRRLLRVAGFVTPGVLLAAVAAAGMAGPKPTPSASPLGSAVADPLPSSSGPTLAPAALSAPPAPAYGSAPFPVAYLTLATMHPSEVLAARSTADGAPLVIAVVGYLGDTSPFGACADPEAAGGAWCERRGVLADAPFGAAGTFGGFAPHLHVVVPPGVSLPGTLSDAASPGRSWVPVEVLGRFTVPGQCGGGGPSCEQGFVIERVAWVDGSPAPVVPLRQPGVSPTAPATPVVFGASPMLLLADLVRPAAIAALDASAASAAATLRPRSSLVWYIREIGDLDSDGPDEPMIRWAIVDATGGGPVAGGPSTLPTVGAPSPPLATTP